jgi:hypothetical protein
LLLNSYLKWNGFIIFKVGGKPIQWHRDIFIVICIRRVIIIAKKQRMKICDINITNLTFHDLIMEIIQNLFTYNSCVSRIDIVHWKHIWHMGLLEDAKSMWHLFIHRFVFHVSTCLSVSNMFSMHDAHV